MVYAVLFSEGTSIKSFNKNVQLNIIITYLCILDIFCLSSQGIDNIRSH